MLGSVTDWGLGFVYPLNTDKTAYALPKSVRTLFIHLTVAFKHSYFCLKHRVRNEEGCVEMYDILRKCLMGNMQSKLTDRRSINNDEHSS